MGILKGVRRLWDRLKGKRDRHEEVERLPRRETPARPPKSRPPRSQEDRQTRAPVVIGLDFGTSTTKVSFRLVGEDVSWVLPAHADCDGLPWFCTPTTLSMQSGRLNIGYASEAPDTETAGSLKLDLLDSDRKPGEFGPAERRAMTYLGWIIQRARQEILRHYDVDGFRAVLNVGVPVAYFGDKRAFQRQLSRYESVARAALATSKLGGGPGVETGMKEGSLTALIESSIARSGEIENVAIMPESIAALVSLERDPHVDPGIYSVVDIGAGTTEVSTSRLEMTPEGRQIICYMDSTRRDGALDLLRLERDGEDSSGSTLIDGWWKQWKASWDLSRRKDHGNLCLHEKWRQTATVFTGGGGFHPRVQGYFKRMLALAPPANMVFGDDDCSMSTVKYEPSRQALAPCRSGPKEDRTGFHLLAVAHGLSYHRREWPTWYRPDDVKAQRPRARADLPADPEEAGYFEP
jgi:hypothetical protein